MLGLGGPGQEGGDILGLLGLSAEGAVLILDALVGEHLWHGNSAAREVWVVVQTLADRDAGRRVAVAEEKGEHVVLAVVAGLCDEAEVRRVGAAIGVARMGLVHVGGGQLVGQLAGALKHLALVVGPVGDLDLGRHGLGFLLSVAHTHQVAVVHQVQAVAGGADLSVDLMATADGGMVICIEHSGMGPRVLPGVQAVLRFVRKYGACSASH
mmetsp:Transcript_16469/g.45930  ORF Transcript_16469/g.45930 Transcript_16469/m.45930 type:complete len:211 (+) Transcript_16469:258-890(+)